MSADYVCQISSPYYVYVLKKLHLVKFGAFAWYSVKIRVVFGVLFERRKVDKKQTYTKSEKWNFILES